MVTALPGQIKGVEEVAQGNSSAISNVDGQVSALDTRMSGVTDGIKADIRGDAGKFPSHQPG